ncbi:MAG: DUF2079 domain-containing protein, partial [Candidatus Omnitrophica bacterium]|nr:DUF2079 domain-containing protein [Candidatus Omnitrophota bacterium]
MESCFSLSIKWPRIKIFFVKTRVYFNAYLAECKCPVHSTLRSNKRNKANKNSVSRLLLSYTYFVPGNNRTINLLAIGTCTALAGVWGLVLTLKYYHFGYTGSDLALYAQLMWNLAHGNTHTSLFGGNFLIDHANYIAFLLAPLFAILPTALALLYLKVIVFFAGAYVLYLIALKKLSPALSFFFMLGYVVYPPNISMLFFEFNFENLAPAFIFLAFYFFDQKRLMPFLLTGLLLASIKEN